MQGSVNPGTVNEEPLTSATRPEPLALSSRFSGLISGALDSISYSFFCVSFSSLIHALGTVWYRFSSEE